MDLNLLPHTHVAPALGDYARFSPLVLADRLIGLAQEADRAGYTDAASSLVRLMFSVLDTEVPQQSWQQS